MVQALGAGKIVIVAGFQGVDEHYNITTLGRGGSDTTAVALAAVLGASGCEIYTDVDGVYTTDPRDVPEARKIDRISYDEMLELASLGAGVMHSRSIEFAKKYGVPIHVRSSFSDAPGTWIVDEHDAKRLGAPVTGAALARDEARLTILGVPDRPGVVHAIFRTIAAANIVVDMIVQNVSSGGTTEVSFTVAEHDLPATLLAAESAARAIGAGGVTHDAEVAKISVVGLGMRTHTGVATTMFEALAEAGINIQMITTSEIKISVLVDRASAVPALKTVHRAFVLHQLDSAPMPYAPQTRFVQEAMKLVPLADTDVETSNGLDADARAGEARSGGMEDLVIAGVELDESQARVALFRVPDRPGYAARVFRAIGEAGVFVDMIVQNVGIEGDSVLSFTVPKDVAERAALAVKSAGISDVSIEPALAKLSVIGVGMRTHTGVATRMFAALAERGININLINTSEIRVNVGTDIGRGREGLESLKRAFAL
jgi:aspartate kinase